MITDNRVTPPENSFERLKTLIDKSGISDGALGKIEPLLYIIVVGVISLIVAEIAYRIAHIVINRILKHKEYTLLSKLLEHNVLRKQAYIIPPIIMEAALPLILDEGTTAMKYADMFVGIFFVVMLTRAITAIISSVGETAFKNRKYHDRPIKGFIQVAKIIVYIITATLIISIITNKSPLYLIGGLGAFAAVLMLIAKDSIMGFVGGFLLLENDMIRLGDWIEVPGNSIDGIVFDISLTIVKVRNFDNTIATIPPYTLINQSFVNWRGINDSGARRIARGYTVKLDNIKPCNIEFLERMKQMDEDFANYITTYRQQLMSEGKAEIPGGTADTNAGLFRAYADIYLHKHPHVRKDMLIMVRTLEPTANGLPIQFYCFTDTTEWVKYEGIQSQIMEHFASVMPLFELYPYQNTSARDTIISGMLEASFPLERIKGVPYETAI